ncbi:zinc-dependent alcohol dehydrogenase [Tessaracoccus antarcticus]|uniref:Alcohol dehydrogenase n=1 Tax=Tessaracoccus antarcticus TaxID=2479848 RepID=A0A3M0GLR7_9ACTN|nr:alcohol dehydrogenase catalytic domain-containing protein [Tessaracoccus antarcticus]RMB58246.1 alcohol dehydrogenase [Tessaracoccus antarcticus]
MRAARLHAPSDLRVGEESDPTPAEGFTLVRVGAVGLCGSDLHWFLDGGIGDSRIDQPTIPGHEIGGVALDGPLAGRTVAVDPAIPCFTCERCREGWTNLCPHVRFAGHGDTDGGLAEMMRWPTDRLVPLPECMDAEDAAVLEPLGVAIHAWDLSHVGLGDRVAIVGAGPIGLLLVQLARHSLVNHIAVIEPLAHRRDAALAQGADAVHSPDDLPASDFDVVFEVCGNPDPVREAMVVARAGGRVVLVGIPDEDETRFPASLARRKGLTIAVVRRMAEVYDRSVDLVVRGVVDVKAVVSHRFELGAAGEAFTFASSREGLKVLITP